MPKPIIEIENISKRYRIGAHKEPYLSLRDEIARFASRLKSKHLGQSERDFWALKDVSFSVQEGEAVGIIGRNGAGKSTLLKILSQITPPTKGRITMRGRVASLLEVGTGFHPELTGRENIFLNGAILGMTRTEIRRKFEEIVTFAEVEQFLDTPVKRYSSGMYVRLAFAVAAHLEPEILVVDEVLAVGDAEFQKKCLGKMSEVAKGGRTVLLVSHNMAAVSNLCSSCVLLEKGRLLAKGESFHTIEMYLSSNSRNGFMDLTYHRNRTSIDNSILKWISIKGQNDRPLICGQPAIISIGFDRHSISSSPEVAVTVETLFGQRVFSFATYWTERTQVMDFPNGVATCLIHKLPLAPGTYTINVAVGTANNLFQDHIANACQFEVESTDYYGSGKMPSSTHGVVLVDASWIAEKESAK